MQAEQADAGAWLPHGTAGQASHLLRIAVIIELSPAHVSGEAPCARQVFVQGTGSVAADSPVQTSLKAQQRREGRGRRTLAAADGRALFQLR